MIIAPADCTLTYAKLTPISSLLNPHFRGFISIYKTINNSLYSLYHIRILEFYINCYYITKKIEIPLSKKKFDILNNIIAKIYEKLMYFQRKEKSKM